MVTRLIQATSGMVLASAFVLWMLLAEPGSLLPLCLTLASLALAHGAIWRLLAYQLPEKILAAYRYGLVFVALVLFGFGMKLSSLLVVGYVVTLLLFLRLGPSLLLALVERADRNRQSSS